MGGLSASLFCLSLMAAAPARVAATAPISYDADVPAPALEKIRELLEDGFGAQLAYGSSQLGQLASGQASGPPAAVGTAKKHLQAAQRAYANVDYPGALAELDAAEAALDAGASELRPEDFELHLVLLAERALVLQTKGDLTAMDAALNALASFRPDYKLNAVNYPPTLHESLAAASLLVRKRGNGSIEVASTPGFATVYVDGVERGKTPLTVKELPLGEHLVLVERALYRPVARKVKVTDSGDRIVIVLPPDRVAEELSALAREQKAGFERAALLERARAAAVALGVDALAVTAVLPAESGFVVATALVGPGGLISSAYGQIDADLISGRTVTQALVAKLNAGASAALASAAPAKPLRPLDWNKFLNGVGPAPRVELVEAPPPPPPPPPTPLYKRWGFWVVSGAVLAGGATGVYFLTRPAETQTAPARTDITVTSIQ